MIGVVRGIITLTLLLLFIVLAVWAWGRSRKGVFDQMARLPLEEDEDSNDGTRGRQK
jgi:cytochrome c oxidase cbb3-type subunit 4